MNLRFVKFEKEPVIGTVPERLLLERSLHYNNQKTIAMRVVYLLIFVGVLTSMRRDTYRIVREFILVREPGIASLMVLLLRRLFQQKFILTEKCDLYT